MKLIRQAIQHSIKPEINSATKAALISVLVWLINAELLKLAEFINQMALNQFNNQSEFNNLLQWNSLTAMNWIGCNLNEFMNWFIDWLRHWFHFSIVCFEVILADVAFIHCHYSFQFISLSLLISDFRLLI